MAPPDTTRRADPGPGPDAAREQRPAGYRFLLIGGAALACCAGATNMLAMLGGLHHPATHVTGTLTSLPSAIAQGDGPTIGVLSTLLLGFLLGAALSGAVIESTELRVGRRYGVLLMAAGSALALGATLLGHAHPAIGGAFIAGGAGIQNAMATRISAAVVRTTHMSGIVTDLGIALGKALAGRGVTRWRVTLYLSLLGGFTGGCVLGVELHHGLADAGLYAIAGVLVTAGVGYFIWRIRHFQAFPG
ncbi:MAG: YoaK family protein [bacterium]